jgi:6-pyruvoyltetrahydropterin/6-carboxytetrahydropterin synthase
MAEALSTTRRPHVYKISKKFSFCASHQLTGLPEGHQCARLHGHNYQITVHLAAPDDGLDGVGFVRDYGKLDVIKTFIDLNLEHRHLNDIVPFNPTAENLAKWFYDQLKPSVPEMDAVSVKETDKTEALYVDETEYNKKFQVLRDLVEKMESLGKLFTDSDK